jgi:hypothetical protein
MAYLLQTLLSTKGKNSEPTRKRELLFRFMNKHNIQWHSISMHASSCSVHMSIRNSILTRDAAVPRCPRRPQRDMGHACSCALPLLDLPALPFSYGTCMLTCRINFYCAFSLPASGACRRLLPASVPLTYASCKRMREWCI